MAFKYELELKDGTPAEPPSFTAAVPNWKAGDAIPLGAGRSLRVVEVREGVLVVESLPQANLTSDHVSAGSQRTQKTKR